jgi:tetratricopeptide (TPR) repeat protein
VAHEVFISYASDDKPVADAVCATLEARGVRCWIAPRDLLPGRPYPEAIEEAISNSRVMVIVFSQPAADSRDVRSEIHLAFQQEITIVPFRIQDMHFPKGMKYWLGAVHWLDAITPPLEHHLRTLSERICEHLITGSQITPAKPERSSNPKARACHERGVAYYRKKEYENAIAELTHAIELDSSIAWAFNDRGLAHFQRNELDLAIKDLTHGIDLDPTRAWAWHGRGCAFSRRGNFDAAIRDFTEAIHCDAGVAWFYHDRGAARVQAKSFTDAVVDFTQALLLNPQLEWAYRNRATAYDHLGKKEMAESDRHTADQLTKET